MLADLATQADRLTRVNAARKPPPIDLAATTFPEASAFIRDQSQFKAEFCTRRAAKSYSVGLEHAESATQYPAQHLILGLTRESVRNSFWDDVLKQINFKHQLGLRFNETLLEARAPSGGVIRLLGMDSNDTEKRKALGAKRKKIHIDEAQDFRTDLRPLVYGTLKPSVADWRGSISMGGTPGNITRGLFYDVTRGEEKGWSLHRWTTFQNTAVPAGQTQRMCDQWRDEIEALKATNPRVVETPWFRQNYLGEWVIEDDARVYRYQAGRNDFDGKLPAYPKGEWRYLLGVDLGHTDAASFQVGAFHDHDPNLYLLSAYKRPGMDFTDVANHAKALDRTYGFISWIVDGANKQGVEEMRRRHSCPWVAADKTAKFDFVDLMNADFICGTIKLGPECDPLRKEYESLIVDPKKLAIGVREEHPACQNHCADGALYLWRRAYQYLSERLPTPVPYGTPAWAAKEEAEMEEYALEQQAEEERAQKEMDEWL